MECGPCRDSDACSSGTVQSVRHPDLCHFAACRPGRGSELGEPGLRLSGYAAATMPTMSTVLVTEGDGPRANVANPSPHEPLPA